MAVINMSKSNGNMKINMSKEDGSAMKKVFFGTNWGKNRYAGEADYDLDLNGFLTNSDRKVGYPTDIVNYNTYGDGSAYPWIKYTGDNRTGDDSQGIMFNGQHYDEAFIVDTTKFPADKSEFTMAVSIFRAVQRLQNFGMIDGATLTICDYDDPNGSNTYKFDLTENPNFENLNAIEMGKLYRYNGEFKFQALGSGYVGGMTELFKNFGLDIDEGRD